MFLVIGHSSISNYSFQVSAEELNDPIDDPVECFYKATTDVVRSVTILSGHIHNTAENDSASQFRNAVLEIVKDVQEDYRAVNHARNLISNSSYGQVLHMFLV